jgi:putative addiction module component (TIGR02574 family)
MNPTLEQIKANLSGLPAPDRAELADYLLRSLESSDKDVSEAWHVELKLRMADIRAGKVEGKPVEEVLARLRERYP